MNILMNVTIDNQWATGSQMTNNKAITYSFQSPVQYKAIIINVKYVI